MRHFQKAVALTVMLYSIAASMAAQTLGACTDQGMWSSEQFIITQGTTQYPINISVPLLLTDGRVMVQNTTTWAGLGLNAYQDWFTLTPSTTTNGTCASGSYTCGTWSAPGGIKSLQTILGGAYAPLGFGSAVLADGKLIIEGGEFNGGQNVWTNMGAIYDPFQNSWTAVNPPTGWSNIGDAMSAVLPNKTFMLGHVWPPTESDSALLTESSLTWTETGLNKQEQNSEETWTLLPGMNGGVLTVDAHCVGYPSCNPNYPDNSEVYSPASGTWSSVGSTQEPLYNRSSAEIGPAVLQNDGTVLALGTAYGDGNLPAYAAVYNPSSPLGQRWTLIGQLPTIGSNYMGAGDEPAVLLPDGNVMFEVNNSRWLNNDQGSVSTPYLLEWTGFSGGFCQLTGPSNGIPSQSFFLMLPTGQIFVTSAYAGSNGNYWIYTPGGSASVTNAPKITSVASTLSRGSTYLISGMRFNGMSQDSSYGDDFQNATNYPLVKIVNNASGDTFYARTHDHSTMAVSTALSPVYTHFDVPSNAETGASKLYVVANGIPSTPANVTVQ
jgi:hypothetical protein